MLPVSTFQQELHWGLGCALQQLQREVSLQMREQVLDACLYCRQFDPQIEGQRSAYLLEAARLAGVLPQLGLLLIKQLEALNKGDFDHWDTVQRLDLLTQLGKRGDEVAARTIRQLYAQHSQNITELHELLAEYLMMLDGVEGLERVLNDEAAVFVQDGSVNSSVIWQAELILGNLQANRIIKRLARQDFSVDGYIKGIRKTYKPKKKPSKLPKNYSELENSLPNLKTHIFGGAYFRFLEMNQQEWQQLASDLTAETDPERQAVLVSAFAYQPTQYGLEHIFALLEQQNERVVWRAQQTLAYHHEPRVRELALEYLSKPELVSVGIKLLTKNARPGDGVWLRQLISEKAVLEDADGLHNLLFDLPNLLEQNPTEEFAQLLADVYTCQPCADCRLNMVEALLETLYFPDWLKAEAILDANPEIHKAFELARIQ